MKKFNHLFLALIVTFFGATVFPGCDSSGGEEAVQPDAYAPRPPAEEAPEGSPKNAAENMADG